MCVYLYMGGLPTRDLRIARVCDRVGQQYGQGGFSRDEWQHQRPRLLCVCSGRRCRGVTKTWPDLEHVGPACRDSLLGVLEGSGLGKPGVRVDARQNRAVFARPLAGTLHYTPRAAVDCIQFAQYAMYNRNQSLTPFLLRIFCRSLCCENGIDAQC